MQPQPTTVNVRSGCEVEEEGGGIGGTDRPSQRPDEPPASFGIFQLSLRSEASIFFSLRRKSFSQREGAGTVPTWRETEELYIPLEDFYIDKAEDFYCPPSSSIW